MGDWESRSLSAVEGIPPGGHTRELGTPGRTNAVVGPSWPNFGAGDPPGPVPANETPWRRNESFAARARAWFASPVLRDGSEG